VPLTGAPQSLSKAQYLADPNFVNIDNKLKREANLAGYEVVEVTRQLVNGNIYTITYKNSNGVTIIYRVYISFSGDIQVQNTTTTGQDQAQPKPQEQVPPMPGAPQSLSKAQYLADPNFVNIDNKLKREANLAGYEVVEVTRQLVNGNIYTITYKNSNGVTIIYRVYISFSGDIQVQNTTTTGQDQAQPKPQEQVPPMPGAPQSLSKAQYLADPNFVNIDNKLKREANLAGYEVVEVTRQLVNGNIYTITYKNSNGVTIIYRVYISFSGDIQVQNTTTTGQDQAQPKPQEQVPPMPGAPQSLSKAQYLADPNFVNIDNKLKREANLAGYEVVEVTRQLVNGNIYTITYKNSNGVTIIYRVYISFSGDIQVQNTTTTGQDQAQPKPQEQVPPMPGAPQSLSKAQYLADPNFVNIDNKLKREANLAGYEVVEVTRQLVNGNIYTITYKNSNGVTIIYRVYISFSGDIQVQNTTTTGQDQAQPKPQEQVPPMPGAPQSLSKAQYLADPNFVNIDNKLKREANLAGYEVVEVTRQLVNGNIYTITYKNSNGVTIIYRVYISFSGDIQVQNTTTTGQDQAQPKPQEQVPPMPGAPQSLSKAQYLADPNFVNIDNKLKREANLAGYEVVEVTRQLVNGNIYTITYKNSNGVTIIYRVYISFSGDIQVQNTTTTGQDQAQPKPQEQVPPMPGAPQSLSKAQYLADPNFVNIDNKLKREANLAGYEVVEVTRQLVNGNIYTITYKNSNGVTIIYRVYISFSGDIQVQNTTTTGQDQAQPKPQEQVPPMPGAPQSLSKAQYLADPNFVNIDNKLKREANLAGYEVVEVTRQLVNGNIYTITYKNSNGVTIIYRVYISFSGDIQVQNTTTTGQDQAQPKPQEQVPPMPGAPQSLSKAQYLADPNFVNIDNKLKREANLAGYEVVEVTRQLVNGNIYTITYKNSNGVTIIYRVYISFSGDIQVQNTIGNPPPKVQAEKNPIPVTTSPSAPPSIVPFELLRMVQTETFTPFSSFSTTFINLAAFANKLITQYAPIFKSFQFVIYNSSSNIYKFITSNWIDFIVTSNGSSDYVLD
jgi:xanthosine utilization system XapX-like protein